MIETSSPTVWRRWLAFEIKRMRQESGLHQSDVAQAIGSQVPKISLIEKGQRNVQERDLEKLLPLFDVPEDRWDDYFTAAKNAHRKAWWDVYAEHTVPDYLRFLVGLEQGAQRLRTYHPAIFPGLLQTRDYATRILQYFSRGRSQAAIEQLVEMRIRRQEVLWRARDPVPMWPIVDEAALRRVVGDRDTMRTQLQHVADVARQHDHINLQVVPFDSTATLDATYGSFTILSFGWPTDPGVVYLEHPSTGEFFDSVADTDQYSMLFEKVRSMALPPERSVQMLLSTAREY